jgi:hypothetical protein
MEKIIIKSSKRNKKKAAQKTGEAQDWEGSAKEDGATVESGLTLLLPAWLTRGVKVRYNRATG